MRKISEAEIKRISYDTLVYFADFCESHGLRYFLAYGTLLGAVRHGGFIPWDDDVDVWMPREDYDKLLYVYKSDIDGKRYELDAIELNPLFWNPFAKLSRKGTILLPPPFFNEYTMKVALDIFPLDSFDASGDGAEARAEYAHFWRRETKIIRSYRRGRTAGLRKLVKSVLYKAACLRYGDIAPRMLTWARMLADRSCRDGVPYLAMVAFDDLYRKEWFQTPVKLKFESGSFYAPSDYDAVLRTRYGDYMTPPPPRGRKAPHPFTAYYLNDEASGNEDGNVP